MLNKQKLVKEIKSSVKWLINEDCGCVTIKLDDTFAVCVGWSDGYDVTDTDVIHSKQSPTWCINAGIKVWTSDSMRTDYDFINSPYYEDTEDVWDTDVSISPLENYEELADYFLTEYEAMSKFEIENDGKIIGYKNLWVCDRCLMAIESHEGSQATLQHNVNENDKVASKCSWCHENGFDTLYELI